MKRITLTLIGLGCLTSTCAIADEQQSGPIRYIDGHMHLAVHTRDGMDFDGAARSALRAMDKLGMDRCLLMPPPNTPNQRGAYDYKKLAAICKKHPKRFAFIGGGGSLNKMIQQSIREGRVSAALRARFVAKAHEIARAGAAGYGEFAATHLSFNAKHPFIHAAADHPLFLALADIAAKNGLPIDIHMEAVPHDMSLPKGVNIPLRSPPNPKRLTENVTGLERLLAHNRKAKIIWAHAGWGHTAKRTVALTRALLSKHPNLYLGLKFQDHSRSETQLLSDGKLRSAWLALIKAYPDQFLLGSDQFFGIPGKTKPFPRGAHHSRTLMRQLPRALAGKIGVTNAKRVYKLK